MVLRTCQREVGLYVLVLVLVLGVSDQELPRAGHDEFGEVVDDR